MSDEPKTPDGPQQASGADIQQIGAVLAPLLEALQVLEEISRRLHPPALQALVEAAAPTGEALKSAVAAAPDWPDHLAPLGRQMDAAAENATAAFAGLREAAGSENATLLAYKALRHLPRALEAMYPLAGLLAPVSRHFLEPDQRADNALQERLSGVAPEGTGVLAFGPDVDSRETFWAYVPETYDPATAHPLVVALHGGSGKGRTFLYSWLRTARSRGAILIAPTSLGGTWALQGDDIDSPHLARIVDFARERWTIDERRMLMTGMSDGGTFTYVSGLLAGSPFTHLAPFSAAFHPMLGMFAEAARVRELPVHVVHGGLDWMFPADMARMAHEWLQQAGARVTYREIPDLSHTYAADLNGEILDWVDATAGSRSSDKDPEIHVDDRPGKD
ncbi:MAG: phospholipase [Minwuia sp.]|uniref:phospholipase n=1 Tax=Minwuia sp. TaxID=2493630 RepID=UPI003A8361AB